MAQAQCLGPPSPKMLEDSVKDITEFIKSETKHPYIRLDKYDVYMRQYIKTKHKVSQETDPNMVMP